MTRKPEYELEEVKVHCKAYRKDNRKVIKHNKVGLITIPSRFIGKTFDLILIPKDVTI